MAKEFTLEEARSVPVARPSTRPFSLNEALGKNQEPDTSPQVDSPMGDDFGSAIMAASELPKAPKPTGSVFDTQPFNPEFNPVEAAKLSRRDYAEEAGRPLPVGSIKPSPAKNDIGDIAKGLATAPLTGFGKGVSTAVRGVGNFFANEAIGNPELAAQGKSLEDIGARMYQQEAKKEERNQPTFETSTGQALYGGAKSLETLLATYAASGGNPAATLAMMSAGTGVGATGEALEKGKGIGTALGYGAGQAALEYATEKMPLGFLAEKLGKEGFKQFIGGFLLRELPSEQIATITQDALQKAVLEPEKTWTDYLKERPEAAYQTLVATGVMAGGVSALNSATNAINNKQREDLANAAKATALDKWATFGAPPTRPTTVEDLVKTLQTSPTPTPSSTEPKPEAVAAPATPAATTELSKQREEEQKRVLDLEQEMEAPEAEKGAEFTLKEAIAPPAVVKAEEDYANKSFEELQGLRENADQTNHAMDMAAIEKHLGAEVAAQYDSMNRRQRAKWWEQNATEAIDRDSSTFNGVNEDLLDEYIKAHNNFDTESPRALGRSVGLIARDINDPKFVGSPDFVRLKNALAYATEQGWSEAEVLGGMRERASEWAGADAQELFKDLFKPKPAAAPEMGLTLAEEEDNTPFAGEDLTNEPMPARPEVQDLLDQQSEANKAAESLGKRTAGTSLIKVLQGSLRDSEMSELGGRSRQIGKNPFISLVAKKGTPGSSMEDMVNGGLLNDFLPYNMRPDAETYDNAESAEYIRDKLRQGQYYTYETQRAIEDVNRGIWDLEKLIQEELSLDDINKEIQRAFDEQREADLVTEEAAPESKAGGTEPSPAAKTNDELDKREAQLEREAQLNEREARLLEERKRLEEERLKLESPTKEDVVEQEERKAKAAEQDEKDQIRKESEAGAGQFELTQEEGRQDTTGSLFDQTAAEPEAVEVSTEQERKEALDNFKKNLAVPIPPFRARSARGTQSLKPTPLTKPLLQEVMKLASDAIDLGLPPSVLGNVTAAGSTRMDVAAVMSESGWLMIAKKWKSESSASKLQTLIHELAHAVDTNGGKISNAAQWGKAHTELKNWYDSSSNKFQHPMAYPFAPQYKGRVRPKEESFAQAFSFYFTSPVDLQKNAPEAYSQIQAIVERINNGSQAARTAGTTSTGTAGIKIQPSRTEANTAVQPGAGAVSTAVSPTTRLEDRSAASLTNTPAFKRWFGDSKMVSADGSPKVVYHGTTGDISKFKLSEKAHRAGNPDGFYFSTSPQDASRYAGEKEGANVMSAYLKLENPFLENSRVNGAMLYQFEKELRADNPNLNDDWIRSKINIFKENAARNSRWFPGLFPNISFPTDAMTRVLEAGGYDGFQDGQHFIVIRPEQIKSATGNSGEFNPEEQDINMMMSAPETPAFKRWSYDLPIYDSLSDDNPGDRGVYRVYHATRADFKEFIPGGLNPKDSGPATWLSPYADYQAAHFRTGNAKSGFREGTNVMPLYARVASPLVIDDKDMLKWAQKAYGDSEFPQLLSQKTVDLLKADGYDSILFKGERLGWGEHADEIIVLSPNQLKSAIGNNGEFNPEVVDINASAGNTIFNQRPLVNWTSPEFTDKDKFIYVIQNRQIDTKRVVDEITKSVGAIDDRWNPYLMEELFHGRAAKQTKDFLVNELRPLLKEMDRLSVTIPELEEYLHNKHAEERNKQVAKVNPTMPDGGSGIDTADARAYLAALTPEQKKNFDQVNRMVKVITGNTRQMLVDSGLESQDTIDAWEKTYGEYVPLNRDDVDYSSNQGQSAGQGFSVRGASSKRAVGSTRKVVDILANIAMQRERTIVRAEKNRVATALYGLALKNPNPKFWIAVNPDSKKDMQATINELVNMGLTAQDALNLMKEPTQTVVDPQTGLVTQRVNPVLRGANNVMAIRVNGKDRFVFFNQNNERANRMVTALKNLDADQLGWVMSNMAKGTRYFASINTQYNPVFGVYNFLRDMEGATLQLTNTALAGKQKEVMKNVMPAVAGIYSQLRADHKGKVATGQWSKLWEEFQQQGGQTGFRDQFSRAEERSQALERELKKMSQGKANQAKDKIFDWLSDYNETMENAVRLAAYKAGLDNGMSKEKAASLAKNLTVNFNRKGQISTQAGALYAFFNSAVQGTTRLGETLTGPAGKTILAGGFILGSMQAALLAGMGFGDDDPPDFVKDKNFIIPLMNGKYLAIPMPLGYNVIPSTARILAEGAIDFAQGKKVNAPKRLEHIMGLLLDAFNPVGNAGWSAQTFAPTLGDPIVALLENKDWTGKPIAKQDFNKLDPTPGYMRAKETASIFGKKISEFINYASGGTKDVPGIVSPTPDQIDYLIGQATGGLGREALKASSTIQAIKSGEELPPHKIPLIGRFYGDIKGSSSVANHFYENIKKMNEYENTVKGMRERRENVQQLYKENPEARAYQFANEVEREVQKLRKLRHAQVEKGAPKETVQSTEKRITSQMKRLNDRIESLEKKRSRSED